MYGRLFVIRQSLREPSRFTVQLTRATPLTCIADASRVNRMSAGVTTDGFIMPGAEEDRFGPISGPTHDAADLSADTSDDPARHAADDSADLAGGSGFGFGEKAPGLLGDLLGLRCLDDGVWFLDDLSLLGLRLRLATAAGRGAAEEVEAEGIEERDRAELSPGHPTSDARRCRARARGEERGRRWIASRRDPIAVAECSVRGRIQTSLPAPRSAGLVCSAHTLVSFRSPVLRTVNACPRRGWGCRCRRRHRRPCSRHVRAAAVVARAPIVACASVVAASASAIVAGGAAIVGASAAVVAASATISVVPRGGGGGRVGRCRRRGQGAGYDSDRCRCDRSEKKALW